VAGVLAGIVAAIPDLHANVQDIFGHGDEVVVRLVVTGTQEGPCWASPPPGATSSGTRSTSTGSRAARSARNGRPRTSPRSSTTPVRTRRPGSPDPVASPEVDVAPEQDWPCHVSRQSSLISIFC
jgi:hypothetical protein